MTTRKQLQEWLYIFPEDTIIEIAIQQSARNYEGFGSVYFISPDLKEEVCGDGWEFLDFTNNRFVKEGDDHFGKKNIRKDVFRIHGNCCLKCGSKYKLSLDHIIPICKGGKNCLTNLQPLCKNCNSSKGSKIIDYRKACHMY